MSKLKSLIQELNVTTIATTNDLTATKEDLEGFKTSTDAFYLMWAGAQTAASTHNPSSAVIPRHHFATEMPRHRFAQER